MEALFEAIKSNDLVKAKKAFGAIMLERTAGLIEERRVAIAKSIMIEGEEADEDEDESEEDESDKKDKKDDEESEEEEE